MVAEVVTDAVVLRAVTTGEADRVVTLLTRALGKISALARGAQKSRKRFGGGLTFFVVGEAALKERRGSELWELLRFDARVDHTALAADPVRYAHAAYATELARELAAPRQTDPELFELLVRLYRVVAAAEPSADLLRAFELQLLDTVGLRPALERCVGCGDEAEAGVMDPAAGGLRCRGCAPAARGAGVRPIGVVALSRLRQLQALELEAAAALPALPADDAAQAREAMHALYAAHLPGPLKSLDFIRKLRGAR